jgi:hypothetical protein
MTNMENMQTCVIADMHLLIAVVALADVEAVEVVGDVVGCPGIHVPGWVGVVGGCCSIGRVLLPSEGVIETAAAAYGDVPYLATNLTDRALVVVGVAAASSAAALLLATATSIAAALPTTAVAATIATATRVVVVAALATRVVAVAAMAAIAMATTATPIGEVSAAAASAKVTAATPEASSTAVKSTAARIKTAPATISIHDDLDSASWDNRSRRRALLPG